MNLVLSIPSPVFTHYGCPCYTSSVELGFMLEPLFREGLDDDSVVTRGAGFFRGHGGPRLSCVITL